MSRLDKRVVDNLKAIPMPKLVSSRRLILKGECESARETVKTVIAALTRQHGADSQHKHSMAVWQLLTQVRCNVKE